MDISLYQLAKASEPPTQPLIISPATLKSSIESSLEVLSRQKTAATLWVKLPAGEVWQSDIKHYQQQATGPQTIYICQNEPTLSAEWSSLSTDSSRILPLPLMADNQLKGEYFWLWLSANFIGVIVAQRAPSGGSTNKKLLMETVCAFDLPTVRRVLGGLKQAISDLPADVPEIDTWEELLSEVSPASETLFQVLIDQLQRQEEIRRPASKEKEPDEVAAVKSEKEEGETSIGLDEKFFYRVVQELRTPLTNMKTAMKLLESEQIKPAQRQRYLQLLHTECDRQNSLLTGFQELLQLADSTQQESFQPLKVSDIIPAIVSTYQPLAQEKGVFLGYTVPDRIPAVYCSETWLKQIAIALLHNSIKFTPERGKVSVWAREQGEYIELEFRDSGIGIPMGEIPKIFEPFYRVRTPTNEEVAGAGLGLTIVQQILQRCGGSVNVNSKQGMGSSFKVLLPVHQP
ncbi:MAG: ATPase [Cyanosarcina radialis HA8281-LM2]|jgi:signal transduction histidine kinase|nr:ATPase [Cyanosarcina radialis HA8281-LM2]